MGIEVAFNFGAQFRQSLRQFSGSLRRKFCFDGSYLSLPRHQRRRSQGACRSWIFVAKFCCLNFHIFKPHAHGGQAAAHLGGRGREPGESSQAVRKEVA